MYPKVSREPHGHHAILNPVLYILENRLNFTLHIRCGIILDTLVVSYQSSPPSGLGSRGQGLSGLKTFWSMLLIYEPKYLF